MHDEWVREIKTCFFIQYFLHKKIGRKEICRQTQSTNSNRKMVLICAFQQKWTEVSAVKKL